MVTEHKVYNGGAEALISRLKKMADQRVLVGITSEKNKRQDDKIGNAELAYIHTNGARKAPVIAEMKPALAKGTKYSIAMQIYLHEHGYLQADQSNFFHTPPRPIIQPAIRYYKAEIAKELGIAAKAAMDGQDVRSRLSSVGMLAQARVQDWFTNPANGWAPNAATTIKRKGSAQPLIDTGALRQAITYVVKGAGE